MEAVLKVLLLIAAAASLAGCQTLTDIISAIPDPTPQEKCTANGGRWENIIIYDARGKQISNGECVLSSANSP